MKPYRPGAGGRTWAGDAVAVFGYPLAMVSLTLLGASAAHAQEDGDGPSIALGVNRIAVLDPGFAPAAISTSAARAVDVVPLPPVLLVVGLTTGTSRVTVEREGGPPAVWAVTVTAADTVPSGGPGLRSGREALALPVGGAAVCTIEGATTYVRTDRKEIRVLPFGTHRWLVAVEGAGFGDVVFDSKPPRLIGVSSTTGATATPGACSGPDGVIALAVGETLELDTRYAIEEVRIGAPDVAHATIGGATKVVLTGVRAGTTTVASRASDADPVFLRTVTVTDR